MKIKKFFELHSEEYDYEKIMRILKKTHGWGQGSSKHIEEFENREEYFLNPIDENDYVEKFHIFLTDLTTNRLRGDFNNETSLKIGKFRFGIPVSSQTSIHNKFL